MPEPESAKDTHTCQLCWIVKKMNGEDFRKTAFSNPLYIDTFGVLNQTITFSSFLSMIIVVVDHEFLHDLNSERINPYLIETVSFSYTFAELAIIVMPGCKCQYIYVSSGLLRSMCQHLIDVSACTEPRQQRMSIFTHACTWKKLQLHNRIAC